MLCPVNIIWVQYIPSKASKWNSFSSSIRFTRFYKSNVITRSYI